MWWENVHKKQSDRDLVTLTRLSLPRTDSQTTIFTSYYFQLSGFSIQHRDEYILFLTPAPGLVLGRFDSLSEEYVERHNIYFGPPAQSSNQPLRRDDSEFIISSLDKIIPWKHMIMIFRHVPQAIAKVVGRSLRP